MLQVGVVLKNTTAKDINIRDVTVVNVRGRTDKEFKAAVKAVSKAVAAGVTGAFQEQIAYLSERLGVARSRIQRLIQTLSDQEVPEEEWPERLDELASEYQQAKKKLAALSPPGSQYAALATAAQEAADAGDSTQAYRLIRQAKQKLVAEGAESAEIQRQAEAAKNEKYLQAAILSSAEGDLAMSEMNYRHAAEAFKEAVGLLPRDQVDHRVRCHEQLGRALQAIGFREGSSKSLEEAADAYRAALREYPATSEPIRRVRTQQDLANVLTRLGERDGDARYLEEAVTAERAAVAAATQLPKLIQAAVQHNLAEGLGKLGHRQGSVGGLEEAVSTYRAALRELGGDSIAMLGLGPKILPRLGLALHVLAAKELELGREEQAKIHVSESAQAYGNCLLVLKKNPQLSPSSTFVEAMEIKLAMLNCYCILGQCDDGLAILDNAVQRFRDLEKEAEPTQSSPLQAEILFHFGATLFQLALKQYEKGMKDSCVDRMTDATTVWSRCQKKATSIWPEARVEELQSLMQSADDIRYEMARS
jgi:tetratricopeptide (TPR) repeat protein